MGSFSILVGIFPESFIKSHNVLNVLMYIDFISTSIKRIILNMLLLKLPEKRKLIIENTDEKRLIMLHKINAVELVLPANTNDMKKKRTI